MINVESIKLKSKDFISIGLYSILLYIVNAAVGMALSPLMIVAMPFISGVCLFFSSTVYMLMAIRVGKQGTLLVMTITTGILYVLMGIPLMLPFFMIAGLVGELILMSGDGSQYRQVKKQAIAYGAYGAIFGMGAFIQLYVLGTKTFEKTNYSKELIDRMMEFAYSPIWMISGFVFSFIMAWIGSLLSTRILKKHFVKAGYLTLQSESTRG